MYYVPLFRAYSDTFFFSFSSCFKSLKFQKSANKTNFNPYRGEQFATYSVLKLQFGPMVIDTTVDPINITRAQCGTVTLRKNLPSARAGSFVIVEFLFSSSRHHIPPRYDHLPQRSGMIARN